MKRLIFAVCIVLLVLTGCSSKSDLPDNPVIFQVMEHTDYRSVVWDDKEYVPYCSIEPADIGGCVGYFEEAGKTIYVCELKGQPSGDWLATTPNLDDRNEGMAFRKTSVTLIPKGLESEPNFYWNN